MSGIRDRVSIYAVKKALYDHAKTLFETDNPEFEQVWGTARRKPDKYVEWYGGDSRQEQGPYGPNRSRNETVRIESMWWVLVRGEVDAAREAEEYLYDRLGELEQSVRMERRPLGGVALSCVLTDVIVETADAQPFVKQAGHVAAAAVVFEAKIRITG
ncbi:MAG: hypothetical protein CMH34_09940 [Microbacterium sp.]|nr:hypothetical protein [Microbacterium sp.]